MLRHCLDEQFAQPSQSNNLVLFKIAGLEQVYGLRLELTSNSTKDDLTGISK